MPKMIFIERDGTRREVDAPLGASVLQVARRHDIDIEGACEGSLACSTCHVIVDTDWYDLLKEASEDEDDMLDLAFNLTQTSRLGCQIIITEELDGLTGRQPAHTRNLLLGSTGPADARRRRAPSPRGPGVADQLARLCRPRIRVAARRRRAAGTVLSALPDPG